MTGDASGQDERAAPSEQKSKLSAMYACHELHNGRIEWLAEHIRSSNFQISEMVARKILDLIEPKNSHCLFELRLLRRRDLPPARKDRQLLAARHFEMALELARRDGFSRKSAKAAQFEVAKIFGVLENTVAKQARPFKQMALDALAEERAEERFHQSKTDI